MNYDDFVCKKLSSSECSGIEDASLDYQMFPHQRDLTEWALRRGRAAIFADTGLGKSRMQLAWADTIHKMTGHDVLILAPLAVAEQTVEEGRSIGVDVTHAREIGDVRAGITITNYDRLHKFDAARFGGVVLDESSVIKHHTAKTLQTLLDAFADTPYKLACTATPAPNDWTELGNHAEFLGVRSRAEMLAEFFCHDGGETQVWRLKGHARQVFWRWVASWGALVRSPADLGHDASAYELPPLRVHQHTVETEHSPLHGTLFAMEAQTLMDRRNARRASLVDRVRAAVLKIKHENDNGLCNRVPTEKWLIWCELNDEQDALEAALLDEGISYVSVRGNTDLDKRVDYERAWRLGNVQVMISKPSVFGWGLNWQHCARMAFVGVTDSFEAYYQAVRRCWRFGQKNPVEVHLFASQQEGSVVANLRRKESDAKEMADSMASETLDAVRESVIGRKKETNDYNPEDKIIIPAFLRVA